MIIEIIAINVINVLFIIDLISSINEVYYFNVKFVFMINCRELFENSFLSFILRNISLILLLRFININVDLV